MHKIEINKAIPQERWAEFFEMFTHGNKGRLIEMESLDRDRGDEALIQSEPLSSIDYQPTQAGNSLIIHTGHNGSTYTHKVDALKEVWTGQDENGVVLAIDIADQQDNHTIVKLAEITIP
jgi:Family of unknown function (DUF5335)